VPAPAGKSESEKGGRGDDLKSNIQVKKLARPSAGNPNPFGCGGQKKQGFWRGAGSHIEYLNI
jgi:hypothetical protein